MQCKMLKPFDNENFTSLEEDKSDNDPNQENSNVESSKDEVDFAYKDKKPLAVE